MAATLKTSRDMFYFVEDIMRLLGYSRSKSYKVIASLNRELEAKGKCTCEGRVISDTSTSGTAWKSRNLPPASGHRRTSWRESERELAPMFGATTEWRCWPWPPW